MWNEYNCALVWTFFGIALLWDWNENWPFPILWPLLNFPNLLKKEMATHSSILAWRIPGLGEPGGWGLWGHKESDTTEWLNWTELKDDSVKVLHSIYQQIWKIHQWSQDWKRSVFIPILKKGNAKKCSNYHTIAFILNARKVMLKIFQARLQQYVN